MLNLRHLQLFREVVERGSFSATARALSYSQPAVSQQIAVLERGVGMPLLDRTTRGVRPTEAGQVFLAHAEAILARASLAETELEALAGVRGGRVRLASFPTAGAALIPQVIALFIDRYPEVELSVIEAVPQDSIQMLKAGKLELALVAERQRPESAFGALYEGIELHQLLDEPMYALLPGDHALAGRRRLRLEDLSDEVWIELSRSPRDPRRHVDLVAAGGTAFEPRVGFQSHDINVVQGMVAAGAGVAVVPELALTSVREDIIVRSLGPSAPVRSVAAATLAGVHRSPATDALLEILHEVSARRPAYPPAGSRPRTALPA